MVISRPRNTRTRVAGSALFLLACSAEVLDKPHPHSDLAGAAGHSRAGMGGVAAHGTLVRGGTTGSLIVATTTGASTGTLNSANGGGGVSSSVASGGTAALVTNVSVGGVIGSGGRSTEPGSALAGSSVAIGYGGRGTMEPASASGGIAGGITGQAAGAGGAGGAAVTSGQAGGVGGVGGVGTTSTQSPGCSNPNVVALVDAADLQSSASGGSGSGAQSFTSLQQAIDAVREGGEVLVCPGTFRLPAGLVVARRLRLRGLAGRDGSTLDGRDVSEAGEPTLIIGAGIDDVTLEGVTFTNGRGRAIVLGDGASASILASTITTNVGGIIVSANAELSLVESLVTNNHTGSILPFDNGGGIRADGNSIVRIMGSTISNNHAKYGAGIHTTGATLTISDSELSKNESNLGGGIFTETTPAVTISNSRIIDNTSTNGAGINFSGASLNISGSTLSGNRSINGHGAAMVLQGGRITLTNSNLANNTCTESGGAIALWSYVTSLTITDCSLTGNSATRDYSLGGALYLRAFPSITTIDVLRTTISNNAAGDSGGGIALIGGGGAEDVVMTITDSFVTGNTAVHQGGGVLINFGSTFKSRNTDFGDGTHSVNNTPYDLTVGNSNLERSVGATFSCVNLACTP